MRFNSFVEPAKSNMCFLIPGAIGPETKKEEFEEHRKEWLGYTLSAGDARGTTALGAAAYKGNAKLIHHIVTSGDKSLFYLADSAGQSALHLAIDCNDKEAGYLAAKQLIQLGMPVNIVKKTHIFGATFFNETPLEKALAVGHVKIAALLLRMHAVARPEKLDATSKETLALSIKEIISENENLFNMRFKKEVPSDVMNHIFLISAMV